MSKFYVGKTATGMDQYLHVEDDKLVVQTTQDVTPVLERNAARRNDGTNGWSPGRTTKSLGDIPFIILWQWGEEAVKKGIVQQPLDILKKEHKWFLLDRLKDRDWSKLRTDK